jgi:hypothetical protein
VVTIIRILFWRCNIIFPWPFSQKEEIMPMGLNSTRFISYHEINTDDCDLIEDAFGLNARFHDVIDLIRIVKPVPDDDVTEKLIRKIRNHH